MNLPLPVSRNHMTPPTGRPGLCWRHFALSLWAFLLAMWLTGGSAHAQTFSYTTDWMGNTLSSSSGAHVPNGIDGIAITPSGTIYSNSWYDEAGAEVAEFNTSGAWVNFTAYLHGFSRTGGYAIAANSTYVYVAMTQGEDLANPIETGTLAGDPLVNGNGLPEYPVNNSGSPSYKAVTGNTWTCISRYTLTGGLTAIPTYGYGQGETYTLVSTTENDSEISPSKNPDVASIGTSGPILGIAANNSYVWVSDYANNTIHIYNASNMAPIATWTGIPSPGAMALDSTTGILWVVENAENNTSSSIVGYSSTVTATATAKGGSIACGTGDQVGAPNALAIDSSDRLLVADNGNFPTTISSGTAAPFVMYPKPNVAQIAVYTTTASGPPVYSYTIGQSVFSGSTPGKVGPLAFHDITGLGLDSSGNFYVSMTGDPHDVGTGACLRKFSSDAANPTQTWQLDGMQFVAGGSLDPANLNQFYSSYPGYSMNWANSPTTGTGSGTVATWNMDTFNPGLYPTDKTTTDVTSDWLIPGNAGDNAPLDEDHPMVFEVRDISGKPFLFTDAQAMGDLFGVMRMNGDVAVPAALVGYNRNGWPSDVPKGQYYYWTDTNGDGCMQAGEFSYGTTGAYNPLDITLCGKWVDDNASLWTASRVTSGTGLGELNEITLASTPLNSYGVPQYNFSTPIQTWVAGTNNVTNDTDWTGLVELAYLPASDTMVIAGNTSTHTSGATNLYDVIRVYNHWSTASTTNKLSHAWEADGTQWKGLYAIGSYVFASGEVDDVNAVSIYSLASGTLTGTMTPASTLATTGTNDEDNPINVRILSDGSYVVFQENDLDNNLTIYRWNPSTGPSFPTTNVVDANGYTEIQGTSTSIADQTNQTTFSTNVATAYSANMGGVVELYATGGALTTAPAIVANYGSGKTLTLGITSGSALATSPLDAPSGPATGNNCLSAPTSGSNMGDVTFTMGAITNGVAGEAVTTFSFTLLAETALDGLTVTATATFSDNTTSVVTETVSRDRNGNPPTDNIFYGFVAPAGKSITSVAITSNTTRGDTTYIGDIGFITSVP
jgi:hypothetical protein